MEEIKSVENDDQKLLEQEEKRVGNVTKIHDNINSGIFPRLVDKVAFVLNYYPQSRNSDVELAYNFWNQFENEVFKDGKIDKRQMFNLTKITSLTRARAKIQNEYKLFLADPEIRKFRRKLRDTFSDENVNDKPHEFSYHVYVDESGKNEDYLIVGSIWLFSFGISNYKKQRELFDWKKENNLNFEFHYKDLKDRTLKNYKKFVEKFIGLYPDLAFKAITVKRKGIANIYSAIEDLTTHLLYHGINQENKSGRATLPRNLNLTVDKDEVGKDAIKMENIKERMRVQNIEGLNLLNFTPEDSFKNEILQMTDLVTASLNRLINYPNKDTCKDKFAKYLLNIINIDPQVLNEESFNIVITDVDNSKIINLN